MWGILVGLIERWWRDKPRKDVVSAIVRLRDSMIECHNWYNQYREAIEAGDIDSLSPNPNAEWIRSLDDLVTALAESDGVLAIFCPEAREAISQYLGDEEDLAASVPLQALSETLGESPAIDLQSGVMEASFSKALNELRLFIAQNFKPEEIYAASKSRSSRLYLFDFPSGQ